MNEISKIIIPGNTIPYDLRDDYARERINNSHLFVVSPLMTGTIDIYTLLGRGVEPYEGLMLHILCTNNNNDSITPTFIRLAANESPIEIEYSNFIRRRPINGGIYSFVLHYIPEEETTPAHWSFYPIDDTLKSKGVEIIEYTTEANAAYAQVKKALSQNILPVVHYIDTDADNYEYWLPLYEYATDKTGYIFSASTAYTSSEDISLSYIRINLDSTTWAIDNCGTNTVGIPTRAQAKGLFYGTCQTSNATAAKTVTGVADWPDSLFAGQTILIKFQHGNNVKENLTLSINGSTAAPIVTYDGVNPAAIWAAGSILLFIYSGTDWRLVDGAAGTTPDWAQNDATMSDYIKNRPGGYDEIVEIVAFAVTVNKSNTEININNGNIDTNKDVIVSINNGDDTTYQWIIEPTETIQVSTGPNQYMSAEQTVYHLGTKDLHDTAWENGDWILIHTLTYRQDGVQFWSTRIKASYDTVNPYFVFKQKINKPVTINQKYTNVLRICFISNGQNWRCDTTYADITEAINAGKLVYADIYEDSNFVMRSYLWKNKFTPDPTFISENRFFNQGRDMRLLFFTIDRYNNISTTSKVLLTFIPDMYGEEGILRSYDGRMSVAAPNLAYMTPSMGITKPDSSLPQIAAGDVLSVSSLSSGVPSKWKTTKVDTTVTADSTNLVTSGAVYDALQDIDIPSAVTDDHINSLIDTKLGVIENGSY